MNLKIVYPEVNPFVNVNLLSQPKWRSVNLKEKPLPDVEPSEMNFTVRMLLLVSSTPEGADVPQ